jgi:hypothetical protein
MKFNIIIAKAIMLINGAMKCIKLKHLNQMLIVHTNANVKNDR